MPPSSLSDFATELLIQVYKSLDNVKDVTALNLVSHQFYDLWLSNALSISDAVFSRMIESIDDARELVKLQQKFLERDHGDDDGQHDPYRRALERNKLMISNAHGFPAFCEAEKQLDPVSLRFNRNDEETHSKIYYRLRMLILAKQDTFAQSSCLASLNFETVKMMCSIIFREGRAHIVSGGVRDVPMWFGIEKVGGECSAEQRRSFRSTLIYVWKILNERGRVLERAEEVEHDVENV